MINIDQLKRDYIANLKAQGFAPTEKPKNIYTLLDEYQRTRSIKTAADIMEDLKNYVILSRDEFKTLTAMAAKAQAIKEKQRKSALRTNAKLTPQELSERNRKVAIARWNKVKNNNLINDIK